jgi:hypothetical protein
MGRDKVKRLRRTAPESSLSSAFLEVLQKMSNDRSNFEEHQEEHSRELVSRADRKLATQERLAADQERLAAAQEFEQEQRIMTIDIDKVAPWQLLAHFIYEFYPSHLLEKGLKYDYITLLGFILTISMSFGEFMNLQGLFRKYAKKPL